MPPRHVLIVDDQRDIRRVLRAALESSGYDLTVYDVPSGEEAILVIARHPMDLLIADVRLPGISGLELKERARGRNPDLKLILITGLDEPRVRREVQRAGADAYFFKPIKVNEFIQAVEACLNLAAGAAVSVPPVLDADIVSPDDAPTIAPNLADRLTLLRQEIGAECAILLSDHGQVMAQAGELPDDAGKEALVSSLMATFSAALKVSFALNSRTPKNWLYFNGQMYDFILAHIGSSLGLLVGVPSFASDQARLGDLLLAIRQAVGDILAVLAGIGVPVTLEEQAPAPVEESAPVEASPEDLSVLDALLSQAGQANLKAEEVDAFWEKLADQETAELSRSDAITYDQARQLGLAPEDQAS